jgi:hypothetical protein
VVLCADRLAELGFDAVLGVVAGVWQVAPLKVMAAKVIPAVAALLYLERTGLTVRRQFLTAIEGERGSTAFTLPGGAAGANAINFPSAQGIPSVPAVVL